MKKGKSFKILWLILALLLCLSACGSENTQSGEKTDTAKAAKGYNTFEYTHYASGGTEETYTAVILFEQSNSTFTSYQIGFSSCTCRDSLVNYFSVCYVELLNTRESGDKAAIRTITFGNNQGLWGDSNPNYYMHDYTEEYMDENLVQPMVGATKEDFDKWSGYGTQIDCVDPDAVTGATVSSSNITSMLRSLFEYHAEHYYGA